MKSGIIRQPLRMLLLPTIPGTEAACARALKGALGALDITPNDFLDWIEFHLHNWRTTGKPAPELHNVVRAVILSTVADATKSAFLQGKRLAEDYFALHLKLMGEHLMSHEEAVAFLSHSFLIAHLAAYERLSAAQIANVLSQRDHRAKFSRQSVDTALQAMQIQSTPSKEKIISLYRRDASQELNIFADADLLTAAERVSAAGTKLGFPGDILSPLKILSPVYCNDIMQSQFTPYLQILHYQCSLAEFVDHAVTDVYEFSPRGKRGEWLHSQYPDAIAGAGNPFLNNAKSVEVLDIGWVRAKKTKERPGAMALLTILEGMQAMGFSARRELAWWIRMWLHRIIRSAAMLPVKIPNELSTQQIERLIQSVGDGNTETFGILEQRMVDAIAMMKHADWRSRGVGDPVNATNISSAKLGDCDFLDVASVSLSAYESHGGELSSVYVEQHISTLKKSILRRIDELATISDIKNWHVTLNFIAHSVRGDIIPSVNIHGLNINIQTISFSDFFRSQVKHVTPLLASTIERHVLGPLKETRTPNEVREKFLAIIQ